MSITHYIITHVYNAKLGEMITHYLITHVYYAKLGEYDDV